jgi:hypothetical protein
MEWLAAAAAPLLLLIVDRVRTVRLPATIRSDGIYGVPAWDPDRCGPRPLAIELVMRGGTRSRSRRRTPRG